MPDSPGVFCIQVVWPWTSKSARQAHRLFSHMVRWRRKASGRAALAIGGG